MKSMKRLWVMILSVALLCVMQPVQGFSFVSAVSAQEEENVFDYQLINNGTEVEIIGCYVVNENVVIPNTIEGKPVTSIGNMTFTMYPESTITVVLPDSVTTIGDSAFMSCQLTEITIPDSVTTIGDSAFMGCHQLAEITIPDSVTSIGDTAFEACTQLAEITIPSSVTEIGNRAFISCNSLTKVIIPDSVTKIGNEVFGSCEALTSVTLPSTTTKINDSMFAWCLSLTEITIPDSVTEIGNSAFNNCRSLEVLNIPNGVTSIGEYAFSNCPSLKELNIPNGVTSIGENAFYGCSKLRAITVPESMTVIGKLAFAGCTAVTKVTFPEGLTEIGEEAFAGCTSLRSFIVPDGVTAIGERAFADCTAMSIGISVPSSVTAIGDQAFTGSPLTIYGNKDTYAEQYAEEWDIPFSTAVMKRSVATDIAEVEGVDGVQFVFNIFLYTEELDAETELDETVKTMLKSQFKDFSLFDITLKQDYEEVQPDGTVQVALDVPEGYNGAQCKVFRAEEDSSLTDMNAVCEENKMIFTTEHFSQYVVAQSNAVLGDVNRDGKVNTTDARIILQFAAGTINATALDPVAADTDHDGKVNTTDARKILQHAAGIITLN